jgi:hypothetical protein
VELRDSARTCPDDSCSREGAAVSVLVVTVTGGVTDTAL